MFSHGPRAFIDTGGTAFAVTTAHTDDAFDDTGGTNGDNLITAARAS